MPEKVFRRGVAGNRQILPQKLLSMCQVPEVAGHRWILFERQQLLLCHGLSENFRNQMCRLSELRGG